MDQDLLPLSKVPRDDGEKTETDTAEAKVPEKTFNASNHPAMDGRFVDVWNVFQGSTSITHVWIWWALRPCLFGGFLEAKSTNNVVCAACISVSK